MIRAPSVRDQIALSIPSASSIVREPKIKPTIAWALSRAVTGLPLNGELAGIVEPYKSMVAHLLKLSLEHRSECFRTMLVARSERDELVNAMSDIDPTGPLPDDDAIRFATAADVRRMMTIVRWKWPGWIPAARISGIASLEGTGKTRFGLDLCKRVWKGMSWPDGQAMTLPPKTPSVWVCADGQHDEIADDLPQFGLPDEAVIFPSPPDDPYANTNLDDPETLSRIEAAIIARKPWALCVDSLTYATSRDLCEQRSIAILKSPLVELVQRHQIVLLLFLHVSAEGQALGKRIKGITRSLLHLECPDPEDSGRLRLWVEKAHNKKPMALGVTMGSDGNAYDLSPPAKLNHVRGGRPSSARDRAKDFIRIALVKANDQIGNDLASECEKTGISKDTFWRAAKELEDAGELAIDGGPGTGKQMILHLIDKTSADSSQGE